MRQFIINNFQFSALDEDTFNQQWLRYLYAHAQDDLAYHFWKTQKNQKEMAHIAYDLISSFFTLKPSESLKLLAALFAEKNIHQTAARAMVNKILQHYKTLNQKTHEHDCIITEIGCRYLQWIAASQKNLPIAELVFFVTYFYQNENINLSLEFLRRLLIHKDLSFLELMPFLNSSSLISLLTTEEKQILFAKELKKQPSNKLAQDYEKMRARFQNKSAMENADWILNAKIPESWKKAGYLRNTLNDLLSELAKQPLSQRATAHTLYRLLKKFSSVLKGADCFKDEAWIWTQLFPAFANFLKPNELATLFCDYEGEFKDNLFDYHKLYQFIVRFNYTAKGHPLLFFHKNYREYRELFASLKDLAPHQEQQQKEMLFFCDSIYFIENLSKQSSEIYLDFHLDQSHLLKQEYDNLILGECYYSPQDLFELRFNVSVSLAMYLIRNIKTQKVEESLEKVLKEICDNIKKEYDNYLEVDKKYNLKFLPSSEPAVPHQVTLAGLKELISLGAKTIHTKVVTSGHYIAYPQNENKPTHTQHLQTIEQGNSHTVVFSLRHLKIDLTAVQRFAAICKTAGPIAQALLLNEDLEIILKENYLALKTIILVALSAEGIPSFDYQKVIHKLSQQNETGSYREYILGLIISGVYSKQIALTLDYYAKVLVSLEKLLALHGSIKIVEMGMIFLSRNFRVLKEDKAIDLIAKTCYLGLNYCFLCPSEPDFLVTIERYIAYVNDFFDTLVQIEPRLIDAHIDALLMLGYRDFILFGLHAQNFIYVLQQPSKLVSNSKKQLKQARALGPRYDILLNFLNKLILKVGNETPDIDPLLSRVRLLRWARATIAEIDLRQLLEPQSLRLKEIKAARIQHEKTWIATSLEQIHQKLDSLHQTYEMPTLPRNYLTQLKSVGLVLKEIHFSITNFLKNGELQNVDERNSVFKSYSTQKERYLSLKNRVENYNV
jgi:hypothetical protein